MEAVPIVVFWCIAAWALFRPKQVLFHLLFACLPFGSFAVLPTPWLGGFTLVPSTIVALMLIARQFCGRRGLARMLDIALAPSAALLLFTFWAIAGMTTLFMPRFFEGQVQVVSMALAEFTTLRPTSQNLSQFVYISISVVATFSFADMLRDRPAHRWASTALCLGAAMTVLTGFLDYASQYVALDSLLDLFRTASYALLTDDEILESKRVVGLMPEASTFGHLTLSFLASLYFFRRAMPGGTLRDRVVPVLMGLLLLLIWLSTSSAAYLGLGALAAAAVADWCWRLVAAGRNTYLRRDLANEFWLSVLGLGLLLLIVVALPRLLDPIGRMFDLMVLQKTESSSYEERSTWTRVSWNALLATHGVGVGLGGTRASNFAVALASNVGLPGAACYLLFVVQCLFVRRLPNADAYGQAMLSALRWSYLPGFLASLTIGTTPDFGLFNSFLCGLSVALTSRARGAALAGGAAVSAFTPEVGASRLAPGRGPRLD
jgi:hypothetical protein